MKNRTLNFLDEKYSRNMDNITRFSLERTLRKETLAGHSWWVSFFTMSMINDIKNIDKSLIVEQFELDCIKYAIIHDFKDEIFTGDLDHNLKYNEFNGRKIRKCVELYGKKALETNYGEKNVVEFSQTDIGVIKDFVKVADWLALIKEVVAEISLGNKNSIKILDYAFLKMNSHLDNYISYLKIGNKANKMANYFKKMKVELEGFETIKKLKYE
jgi:5'-deoxynucleotidase YfbR-like HD superfamily hydrolase